MSLMTPRAYAASLGLAELGKRGRMSAAAHEAIDAARKSGMQFADPTPVKATAPKVIKVTSKAETVTVKAGQFDAKAVRAWAASVGMTTNTRGRLSAEVLAAYAAANPTVKAAEPGTVKSTGKDVRPHAEPTRDGDVRYFAWVGNKRLSLSSRTACTCGYSLSHCNCGSPSVSLGTTVAGRSVDVTMTRGV